MRVLAGGAAAVSSTVMFCSAARRMLAMSGIAWCEANSRPDHSSVPAGPAVGLAPKGKIWRAHSAAGLERRGRRGAHAP